jgi:hypothetical protein
VFCRDGPSAAAMMIASTSKGSACIISRIRWVIRSNQPSRYPDNSPTTTPIPEPSSIAPRLTISEMRAPYIIRAQTSRPMKSQPSQ